MARQLFLSGYECAATFTGKAVSELVGVLDKHKVIGVLTKAHDGVMFAAGTKEVRHCVLTGLLKLVDPNGYLEFVFKAGKFLGGDSRVLGDHLNPVLFLRRL